MNRTRETGEVGHRAYKKNLIINGGFDIWQRGTSFPSAVNQYTADRWKIGTGGQTVSRILTPIASSPYGLRCEISSGFQCQIRQYIETIKDNEYAPLVQNETYTISFWARSDTSTEQPKAVLTSFNGISSPKIVTVISNLNLSTSWQKFEMQITPTAALEAANIGIGVLVELIGSGSVGDTADIAQVQLERGSVATEFEYRSLGEELALCQRYYYDTRRDVNDTLQGVAPVTLSALQTTQPLRFFTNFQFPAPMRVIPTVSMYATAAGPAGYIGVHNDVSTTLTVDSLSGNTRFGAPQRANVSGTVQSDVYVAHISADAEL